MSLKEEREGSSTGSEYLYKSQLMLHSQRMQSLSMHNTVGINYGKPLKLQLVRDQSMFGLQKWSEP
jgi:hypothetical protein